MLIKNIKIWVTKDTQKHDFLKKAHVSRFTTIHHLKAEIESFKMVCNTSLGLFLAETKESPICVPYTTFFSSHPISAGSSYSLAASFSEYFVNFIL